MAKDSSKTVVTLVLIAGGALAVYYLLSSQNTAAAPVAVQPKPVSTGPTNIYGQLTSYLPNIVNAL